MLAKHLVLFMQLPCSSLTSEGPWRTTNLKNKCLVSRRLCKERPPLPTTQSRGCGDPHHLHFQSFSFSYWNAVTICRIYAAMHHDHAICHKVHKGFSWNMFNGCSGSIQIQYESNMNPIWSISICTMVQRWWKYPCQPSSASTGAPVEGTAAERLRYHNATVGRWTTCNMVQHLAILYIIHYDSI